MSAPSTPDSPRPWRGFLVVHGLVQALVLAFALEPARDPDLGFHLATGRAILLRGAIPPTNALTFAEPEAVALHSQWLGAVGLEAAYRALGIAGPLLLKCVLLALTAALVTETARTLGARRSTTLLATALAVLAASFRFVERPLLYANLLLALVAWIAARTLHDTHARTLHDTHARPRTTQIVLGASALGLGAHVHSGAAFAFLLLGALTAVALCAALPRMPRWLCLPRERALPLARALTLVALGGAVLATVSLFAIHPHAARALTVPFTMASDPFLASVIVEFRAPSAFPFEAFAPFWILASLATLAFVGLLGRAPLTALVPLAFGLTLALRYVRFIDLFAWLAAPALALAGTKLLAWRPRADTDAPTAHGALVAGALVLCVFTASGLRIAERGGVGVGWDPAMFPRALLADLRRLGVHGPAFVQDGWAGPYLGFRYPGERVFFHPAFDFYSERFFRESYMRTRDGEPGWEQTLTRHGVRLVVMKYTSPGERRRQEGRPNLRQRLARDPDWALVSFDEHGLAFAARATLTARARGATIESLDPDALRFVGPPERARSGLTALAQRGLDSERARAFRARLTLE
jgi:hypothetical protein